MAAYPEVLVAYRGDDTIKLFTFMDKLRDQALEAGGTVLTHLGNHEWMNVIGRQYYILTHSLTRNRSLGDWRCADTNPFVRLLNTGLDMCTHRKLTHLVRSKPGKI